MSDPKDQLTDDEYAEYLAKSNSFCGRLWANMNTTTTEGEDSLASISELYESLTTGDEEEHQQQQPSQDSNTSLDDDQFALFTDEILSSTFIISDPDEEFFDLFEEDVRLDLTRRRVILEDRIRMAAPTTNPCA